MLSSALLLRIFILFLIYFATASIGLSLNAVSGFATFIWPPTGIALAALFLFGYRLWPGIFFAAFLVNLLTGAPFLAAMGIGVGNTLEALLGVLLLKKVIGFQSNLERVDDVLGLVVLGASVSTLVSATIGVSSLLLTGVVSSAAYIETWTAWWVGDMLGNLVVAPMLLVWSRRPSESLTIRRAFEIGSALLVLISTTFVVFGNIVAFGYPFTYILFLPLIWIAIRFGQYVVTFAIILLSMIAIVGTLQGLGPFVTGSISNSLLLLQLFTAIGASTSLILAAIVSERKSTEARLKKRTRELELAKKHLNEKVEVIEEINADLSFEKVKLEAILGNIGDGLVVTDKAGKVVLMNHVAETTLGISFREVKEKQFIEIFPMENEKGVAIPLKDRPMAQTLATGKKVSATYYYKRLDDTSFPAAIIVTPLIVGTGMVGTIEVFRDVTREKELDRSKDEFISLASHELRTPMTAIKGFLSMIQNGDYGPVNEGLHRPFNNISISAERQIQLINDLLDVSRLQTGRISYHLAEFPLVPVINEIVESLQPLLKQKKLTLTITPSPEIKVQADNVWCKHVLNNLIGNAVKFTDKGGIMLSFSISGDLVSVMVTDTGVGIPLADQAKLFGKFQQLTTQQAGKPVGTGLGLYIAREVSRKTGGDVLLEKSEPGKGSTFVFRIPLAGTPYAQKLKTEFGQEKDIAFGRKER